MHLQFLCKAACILAVNKKPNIMGFLKNLFFKINSQEGQLVFADPENKSDQEQ